MIISNFTAGVLACQGLWGEVRMYDEGDYMQFGRARGCAFLSNQASLCSTGP